ncbi:MAG: outer membrane beta-barrel protein [Paludibacteraceae bacterium]
MEYANIKLLSPNDSTMLTGTISDEFGDYLLNLPVGTDFLLCVSSVGYRAVFQSIRVDENQSVTHLNNIVLDDNSFTLSETTVTAQRVQMSVKTDTMEYDASSYRLRDNAVVEDLLKRLPGIVISEDGKILVNGKEVKKVMVDGKDFFRSNPNLSIKNIQAEIMEKLQVIEDKSELSKLTGIDDGEENITINITIQPGKKRGWLVSNNLGAGKELDGSEGNLLRYTLNSFAARLIEQTQIGLIANGNNINGMNVGGGGSTTGSGKPGLNSSLSGGFNFSSGVEKEREKYPWVINGDLSYGFNESVVRRNSTRQYYLQDSTSYQQDSMNQNSREQGLRFSAKILNRSVKNWTFSFNPSFAYNTVKRENDGITLLQAGNVNRDSVNSNNYYRTSVTPVLDIRGNFTGTYDFNTKGRKFSFNIDSRYSNSESSGETHARYYYYKRKTNRLVNRDQEWKNATEYFVNKLYLSYVEPIAPKHFLQFVYWIQSNNRDNYRNTFKLDTLTDKYSILDIPYSKSIENQSISQQIGISYRGVLQKIVYTVGLDYNPASTRSRSFVQEGLVVGGDSVISYYPRLNTYNYAPNAYLLYNIGKGKSLRFDYRGRSEAPSVAQLDPSRDETNPTNIKMGNPNLLPRFTHWARVRYNNNNKKRQTSLSANLEANYILNDIVSFTNYDDETGIKTTMPVNQSGSWNINGMVLFNKPVGTFFQINNYSQVGMKNNIGFSTVNSRSTSEKTTATTLSLREEMGLTFKWDWLYVLAKADYQMGNTTYSVKSILPKNTSTLGGFLNAQFTLPYSWAISTALNYRRLNGFSEAYNRDEVIWNAEISKSLFKGKKGSVTLLFNDILQQQLSINQIISSNYVEDQQFNTLKSFVMLVFSYRFHSLGKK